MSKKIFMNKLFPRPPSFNYNNLQIDRDSITYITPPYYASIITNIINTLIPSNVMRNDITIMDCTACVGGDTISFGKTFGTVIAIEIIKERYDMLVHNIKEFKLYNVIPINDNSIDILKKINFIDIIYFDPPWGGKSYKDGIDIRLKLGDLFIDEIINIIFNEIISNVKIVVVKLPINYNLKELYDNTKNNDITILLYELDKMNIVVFIRNDYISINDHNVK